MNPHPDRLISPHEKTPPHQRRFKVFFFLGSFAISLYPRVICSEELDVFLVRKDFFKDKEFRALQEGDPEMINKLKDFYLTNKDDCPCKDKDSHNKECIFGLIKSELKI